MAEEKVILTSDGRPKGKKLLMSKAWVCDKCGTENLFGRTICSICGKPKPE